MTTVRDDARPATGEPASAPDEPGVPGTGEQPEQHDQPGQAPASSVRSTDLITMDGPGRALQVSSPREWILQGADEVFRRIYTRTGSTRSEVLAICSAIAGEGKTTVAMGLAVTIAEDFPERRILVVETDIQKPVLAQDFDLEPTPGLVDCLMNNEPVELAYRPTLLENLQIVPAGTSVRNPGRWLRSSNMAMAVDAMRTTHDVVILDIPAVLGNSDSVLLTDLADGVLFVVRAGVTPAAMVDKALEDIDAGRLRGMVLNGAHSSIPKWLRRLLGL